MAFERLRLALLLADFLAQSAHLLSAPLLFFALASFLLQPIEALFFAFKPIMQVCQHLLRIATACQASSAHILLLVRTLQCLTHILLLSHDC